MFADVGDNLVNGAPLKKEFLLTGVLGLLPQLAVESATAARSHRGMTCQMPAARRASYGLQSSPLSRRPEMIWTLDSARKGN
jgi:hypothetical protein